MKLIVFFDGSFWYCFVEYWNEANEYRVIRYVFGKEPNEEILFQFIFEVLPKLITQNDTLILDKTNAEKSIPKRLNPKRMQRLISRQKKQPVLSTKAQAALKVEQEAKKVNRKRRQKVRKDLLKQQKFLQKQAKKLQKHKGH